MDPIRGPRVLLVEDNEDIREGLSTLLEAEGYGIIPVGTAEEGLAQLQRQHVHLLITDYMLPGESGGWLVEQAMKEGCVRQTRVVMITAHPRVVPPAGVRMLHKPLDINEFLNIVEEELAALAQHAA
ncbi:Response regulator receiver domain-containing protein [Stigmatella aurantiaca]|uniref:Response regulator receiver domain-containing protein n=1 Tax=Stigmatella aurantiaca TaxID=41 RepID=A0A1H7SMQ8_STIAU|nr:Response regulator receiver domain-containing protein [Stigmatella aurantiaca]